MTKSNHPKYWNNDKSRALRALTMRLTRLNKERMSLSELEYKDKRNAIEAARKDIYEIPRIEFTIDHRKEIFINHGLILDD